jgi:hypothetical protein
MTNWGFRIRWSAQRGVAGLLILLVMGCTTTLRELRTQAPRVTRQAAGEPLAIARCVQDHNEEHFGGMFGRLGVVMYETRQDGAATDLIGRISTNPSDVLFNLALTPIAANRVDVRLHVDAPWHPWAESAVIKSVDACAPPAP